MLLLLLVSLMFCGPTVVRSNGTDLDSDPSVPPPAPDCRPDVCDLVRELGAMREKVGALENRLRLTEVSPEHGSVMFSAAMENQGQFGPFDTDRTLVFNRVLLNVGDAYNLVTGVFTAPSADVYYFTFFYHSGGDNIADLTLMRNNQQVVAVYDHVSHKDGADNGGNAALLRLQQGDQVFVRMAKNADVWGQISTTTFSGFQVR